MKVSLIAYTVVTGWGAMRDAGWADYPQRSAYEEYSDADYLAEFAGRACYASWSRPNPATATNNGYLAHILEVDHGSVLEHASATFYVEGVSRSLSHELVRHRHLSFSQLSQRFVDESQAMYVVPPAVEDTLAKLRGLAGYEHDALMSWVAAVGTNATEAYEIFVSRLTRLNPNLSRKQVREAARWVLPNATETRFVVTGNMRAWRYVIARRIAPEADAEIQQFAREVLRQLKEIAPSTFQDMP